MGSKGTAVALGVVGVVALVVIFILAPGILHANGSDAAGSDSKQQKVLATGEYQAGTGRVQEAADNLVIETLKGESRVEQAETNKQIATINGTGTDSQQPIIVNVVMPTTPTTPANENNTTNQLK